MWSFFMFVNMEHAMSRIREKSAQNMEPHMRAVEVARAILCAIPLDLARGESKGVWLRRASKLLGIAPAIGKRLYYREVVRIDADRLDLMRAQLNAMNISAAERRESLNELETRLAVIRSDQGSRAAGRSGEGAASPGRRGDGAGEGGLRAGKRAAAPVSRR